MSHHQRKELIRCAESGHATRIRRLLDAGADTEFVANSGMSPLMTACYAGHTDVVSMLLDAGASFNHQPHSLTRGTTNSTLTSNLATVCFALGALLTHNVSLTANQNGSPNTNPFRNGSLTVTRLELRRCTTTGSQLAAHKLKL